MDSTSIRRLSFSLLSLIFVAKLHSQSFVYTDLGTLGGISASAHAINNSGQIVGTSNLTGDTQSRPFLYDSGVLTNLGTLGGETHGYATAINSSGQIVGYLTTPGELITDHFRAFIYESGTIAEIGPIGYTTGALPWTLAQGINDSGQIIGEYGISGQSRGMILTGGSPTELPLLANGTSTSPEGINNAGVTVGLGMLTGGGYSSFVYSGGTMTDLALSFRNAALDINDAGAVVGRTRITVNESIYQAAYLFDGTLTILGRFDGPIAQSEAINNRGEVVGYGQVGDGTTTRAFYYHNGQFIDLNDQVSLPGGTYLSAAYDINDFGQIVGKAMDASGNQRAFLLTPIPEPSTYAMLAGVAAFGLALALRRKV